MQCTIEWQPPLTKDEWNALLRRCPHTTLLQSYAYAQAMREVHYQGVRHGIITIDGTEAGIVQMQEVSLLGKLIHAISIDRGPLWFEGFGSADHLHAYTKVLNDNFLPRIGRKRRLLPEFFQQNSEITIKNWIKSTKKQEYKTFNIDLTPKTEDIRRNLKQKWRNALNKSEKTDLKVEIDQNCESLGLFLSHYIKDRAQKRYAGASSKFLASLAKYAAIDNACFILNAHENGVIIASIIIFTHGHGATYQAGWSAPRGRDLNAHHLLLWRAIEILKGRDITHFDLGGHNDDTGGIRKFKAGLGGHEIALIGSYS